MKNVSLVKKMIIGKCARVRVMYRLEKCVTLKKRVTAKKMCNGKNMGHVKKVCQT